jgi:hypothetical protein
MAAKVVKLKRKLKINFKLNQKKYFTFRSSSRLEQVSCFKNFFKQYNLKYKTIF